MPINARSIHPSTTFDQFRSRRSVVHASDGMVACTQPLAARCGLRILNQGGNAADAAVAIAAGLNMTEPSSTGIGGDTFCLYYDAKTKKVSALNGSGRSGSRVTRELIRNDLALQGEEALRGIPLNSVHAVTVPGAAAGWVDTVERFGSGRLSMEQILLPAIDLGEKGFPVHELSSHHWNAGEALLRHASPNFAEILKECPGTGDGFRAPRPGEIMKNPTLAATFRSLGKEGKAGFYSGRIAEAIVKVCKDLGGYMELEDLQRHMDLGSEAVDPIRLRLASHQSNLPSEHAFETMGGDIKVHPEDGESEQTHNDPVDVWEHPPNGQGIVALMALGILEHLEQSGMVARFTPGNHNSAEHIHAVIESLRIAFADARWWVCDPDVSTIPVDQLISKPYLAERAKLFNPACVSSVVDHGSPAHNHCDTVYFAVTDKDGNGISFINSNYEGFGSGIIPAGCGFTLQNRGANFSLEKDHPNSLAPNKRPYHTIIPAMVTNANDGSLHTVYGVMGGFMQPQGHVQVLMNMLKFKMNPQCALDAPRVCISAQGSRKDADDKDRLVMLEEGISEDVRDKLRKMGHKIEIIKGQERAVFGRGQVIRSHEEAGRIVYSGGSDLRGDGAAYPA
ncbi:gamma-glutamyltranspeptidase [Polychaeton citri CBS 116435]|uniref:Gamma-glutamyltranspeptidase n=1 Tax=Polychaeton citri CBS 116435 TaxID=1314669 RepID=A0A9P4Q8N8_9PEZI|nr:gamma-glutamyltranspeptidase [Polychaeton citri CBS 116435]